MYCSVVTFVACTIHDTEVKYLRTISVSFLKSLEVFFLIINCVISEIVLFILLTAICILMAGMSTRIYHGQFSQLQKIISK